MSIASLISSSLKSRLNRLFGDRSQEVLELIASSIDKSAFDQNYAQSKSQSAGEANSPWDQTDIVLIAYGDQIASAAGATPLQTMLEFLQEHQLPELINTIHFLPFFPSSSDDGFSVIDYRSVDPALGNWSDIEEIGKHCRLMFDFVLNHVSQQSQWFQAYLAGTPPYERFFIEADPKADLSHVTRPRSLPLLHEFVTSRGPRSVWTTFSRDQIDLNFAEPRVLAEAISILLEYVRRGARIIRLDAIAYLWKQIGTPCIHLSQTHEVVKVFREVLEAVAPHVLLITETNVPHKENVSYFGDGYEAHMVYQFSLPPLLLDAFLHHDATPIKNWLANLQSPPAGATYFNFTASHDGIGVRPLEGNVDQARLDSLVNKVKERGGLVSTRRRSDGIDSPYELNISYFDALATDERDQELHLRRFLASQAVMLAMQGIPAVYFHSLMGTPNDYAGVERSGINRRINRRKYQRDELNHVLSSANSLQHHVFRGMQRMLRIRNQQPAFHPDATQRYVESGASEIVAFERHCERSGQRVLVAVNVSVSRARFRVPPAYGDATDLLCDTDSAQRVDQGDWSLAPAQIVWLDAEK